MDTEVTLEDLEQALRQVPRSRRHEVLLFLQFLAYRDEAEDHHLWRAVEAHRAHRAAHPDEPAESYESGDAFLRATDDI